MAWWLLSFEPKEHFAFILAFVLLFVASLTQFSFFLFILWSLDFFSPFCSFLFISFNPSVMVLLFKLLCAFYSVFDTVDLILFRWLLLFASSLASNLTTLYNNNMHINCTKREWLFLFFSSHLPLVIVVVVVIVVLPSLSFCSPFVVDYAFFCWFLHSLCSWAVLFYGNDSSYRIKTQRIQWNSEQNAQINAFIEMRSIFAFSQMIIGLLLFDQFLFLLGSCCSSLYVIISLCAQQIQWDVLHGIYFSKLNICQLNNVILVTDSCWDKNMVMI